MSGRKKYNKLLDPNYKLATEQFTELNKEFYEGFLYDYYSIKVTSLLQIITNTEEFRQALSNKDISLGLLTLETSKKDLDKERMLKYAKLDLAMSYYHCLETFIRIFIAHAKLTGCPWLELAKLDLKKYKSSIEKISKGNFNSFNNVMTVDDTIHFVFTGRKIDEPGLGKEFIEGYKTWLIFAANELLENFSYNSFKHGLAITPGKNGFHLGSEDEFKIEQSGEVLEHLVKMKNGERSIWGKQINWINYNKKATLMLVVEKLIISILSVGKNVLLDKSDKYTIFKAHEFLPEMILYDQDEKSIKVGSIQKGLLYY